VHLVWDGLSFWCELKVSKGNAANISPHQIAWNAAYWARGGSNFFLVKRSKERDLLLFDGDQGALLADAGISGAQGTVFENPKALFVALRPRLLARCPAAPRGV
jgi:hypothetical protein